MGIAVLALAEVGVRLGWGPPPPPTPVYAVSPPSERALVERDGRVIPVFQRLPPDADFPARSALPRIAVVGGSSVHIGDDTGRAPAEFPQLLGQRLGIEVINLGSPGLDSHDHSRLVDELLAFDWTAIVLYAGHNDFGNAFFLRRYAGVSGAMNSAIRGLFGRSALYAWLRGALLQPVGGGDLHYRPGLPKLSDAEVRAAEDALDRNIRRISWRCRRAGVPLVVVVPAVDWMVAPLQVDCDGDRCPQTLYREGLAAVGRDAAEAAAKLREAGDADRQLLHVTTAAQQGMRTVDTDLVVDAERDLPRQNGASIPGHRLFMDSVHFNAQGHRAMARLLADALTKAGIAGGTGSDGRAPRGR